MIIDVHTHTPRFRDEVPPALRGAVEAKWSPGQARPTVYTWAEYLAALAPVDRAIVFNIAADPRSPRPVNEPYVVPTPMVNDETAAFVNAHPDLAGKLAQAKRLTAESTAEQAGAGLDALTDAERARFTALNDAYVAKFGFPFIIAVRGVT